MMGGMGRVLDGGYAEYTSVPASQVIAFTSTLDWAILGAVPETLQTSYGPQDFLDAVARGQISVPVHRRFDLDEIQEAHAYMESGKAAGKLVVTV